MTQRGATKKDISSLRSTLEYLEAVGELVSTDVEVDSLLEVAADPEALRRRRRLLFNKVKGYPNARILQQHLRERRSDRPAPGRRRSAKAQAEGRRGPARSAAGRSR